MRYIVLVGVASIGLLTLSYITFPKLGSIEYVEPTKPLVNEEKIEQKIVAKEMVTVVPEDTRAIVTHVPLPIPLRAIYMTSCVIATKDFRDRLVRLVDDTEINAIIIDVKDFSGTISFEPENQKWKYAWDARRCGAKDMKEFLALLHEKEIFTIARITVFQDPLYTLKRPELAVTKTSDGSVWKDHKGLSFIDVGSQEYWDHIIELATDAYNIGFDELNFDYVRYPSDGNMQDVSFPNSLKSEYGMNKQANLEAFFKYLNEKLDDENRFNAVQHENTGREKSTPWTSVDLFGMTTTNTDDLAIGQIQERAAPYFDFVVPMVYPSHYPHGYLNLGNPNDYPYKIVNHAMKEGVRRMLASTTPVDGFLHERIGTSTPARYTKPVFTADRFRTWIQDFDYGGDYDAADVRAQIQASYDAGVNSWMIWAPSNIYTKEALFPQ